jgi:hypothetical protein
MLSGLQAAGPATAPAGVTVVSVKGSATVRHADGSEAAVSQGMVLKGGDTLNVAPGGVVDLQMGAANRMRLTGPTTFRVDAEAPQGPTFDLLQGELLAALGAVPAGRKVTVRTPTGVAGVEGTSFRLHVEAEHQATEVTVRAGSVRLTGAEEPNRHVTVGERQTAQSVRWRDAVLLATGSGVPPGGAPAASGPPAEAPIVIVVSAAVPIPKEAASPEAAEAIAETRARDEALRELTNRLARHRINAEQTLGARILATEGTLNKVADYAAAAVVTGRRKTDDGRLVVELTLDLKGLSALVGAGADLFPAAIREVDRVAYGRAFGGQARLMAEGAARQDAQRKLVERVHGVVIDATTTVRDLAAADDTIRVRTSGLLRGAKVLATRYFSDGTVEVDMAVRGEECVAALDPGQTGRLGTHYISAPETADLASFLRFRGFTD